MIGRTTGEMGLYIEELQSEEGYAEISLGEAEIVSRYDYIIHTVSLAEINDLVGQFRNTLNSVDKSPYKQLAWHEISDLENILHTLHPHRTTRGLINAGGSLLKFVWGTMDDDDRQNIETHQQTIDENNHILIETVNQQVLINNNFNQSIVTLRDTVANDRKIFAEGLQATTALGKEAINDGMVIIQLIQIQALKNKLQVLQQCITSAKQGIMSPALLTTREIEIFNIDFDKLKGLRIGLVQWINDKLSIVIKVPATTLTTTKKLIIPIPNQQRYEIISDAEIIVEINNDTYTWEEGKSIFELKTTKNCVTRRKCAIRLEKMEKIIEINSNQIVLINIRNQSLESTCDQRVLQLRGNYFVNFNNCTIIIDGARFSNKVVRATQTFVLPKYQKTLTTERIISFQDIALQQEENIKTIEELKFHKTTTAAVGGIGILMIIGLLITVIILCRRQGKINIKVAQPGLHKGFIRNTLIRKRFPIDETTIDNAQ